MPIERILNIKFNKKQKTSASALRWMLSAATPKRATGRTILTLAIIIERALKNPGTPIIIFDHCDLTWGVRMTYKRHILLSLEKMLRNSSINYSRVTIDDYNSTLTIK